MTKILTARVHVGTVEAQPVTISPGIYGQYFEHVEDCVYPGLYRDGVRADVVDLSRELGVPVTRWPGGCFADVYHWRDGVGPREQRPLRRNWHWGGTESNAFGTNEYLEWNERVGSAPYINLNLGTGSLEEALEWLDYCNGTEPTPEVLARREHGREEPWNVRTWGIGNETWAEWEAGRLSAADYALTLQNWAHFFKEYDPNLTLVGVGSRAGEDQEWDREVLRVAGDKIDLLSLHIYGSTIDSRADDELLGIALTPVHLEQRIERFAELIRTERAGKTPIGIAIDEWNIRHWSDLPEGGHRLDRASVRGHRDVLFVAGMFHAMIRHADIVALSNYVFLVNGHGLIRAGEGEAETSAIYPVFQLFRQGLTGPRAEVSVESPSIPMATPFIEHPGYPVDPAGLPERVSALDVVSARPGDGWVYVSLINRDPEHTIVTALSGVEGDPAAIHTLTEEWTTQTALVNGEIQLPPLSVTVVAYSETPPA